MGKQLYPQTTEGWATLHQYFSIDWGGLRGHQEKTKIVDEFVAWLKKNDSYDRENGQSAAFHIIGAKGPLGLMHFRKSFGSLIDVEKDLFSLKIHPFLKISYSFVSAVEMGMYTVTKKIAETLESEGISPSSPSFEEQLEARVAHHKENLLDRAYCEIPTLNYFSFYPMNKKRGEVNNWYREPISKRAELMVEHGMTGRKFSGKIQQIITGAMGFDGWEWGVTLFADDPIQLKNIVHEMRFDDVTSLYGEFGDFWFGKRLKLEEINGWFLG